jgi:hypothetical protein
MVRHPRFLGAPQTVRRYRQSYSRFETQGEIEQGALLQERKGPEHGQCPDPLGHFIDSR